MRSTGKLLRPVSSAHGRSRKSRYAPLLALALASVLLVLVLFEVGIRIVRGQLFSAEHLILERRGRWKGDFYQPDAKVGWSPIPDAQVSGLEMGWQDETLIQGTYRGAVVTATAEGLRSNGVSRDLPERPRILAVGDSFTFGGRVSDHQTWPSELEGLLGVRVLNGGVSAFGLDQSVLRAELLTPLHEPDLLVVSFIIGDLVRNIRASFGKAPKPYFRIVEGRLLLDNTPVPPPLEDLDWFRKVLGYSYLADAVLDRAAPLYWRKGPMRKTGEDGEEIGCLLMGRLAELGRREAIPVIVMAQQARAEEKPDEARRVLACAERQEIATLDLFPALDRVRREDSERHDAFFFGHMTPRGNRFVAEVLADKIRSADWLR